MKYSVLGILFILLLSSQGVAQVRVKVDNKLKSKSMIEVELKTIKDTLHLEQEFPIYLKISNKTNKTIFIPKNTDLTSNLYPNGVNEIWDGAIVKLDLEPSSGFASIIQENTSMITSIEFIKVKANAHVELHLGDLNQHIQNFNNTIDSEDFVVKSKKSYTLQATYLNTRKKNRKAM